MKFSFFIFYIFFVLIPCFENLAQTALWPPVKGLYVDGFDSILGNQGKEDSLLSFAKKIISITSHFITCI
jgi:hypothetical protein